MQAHDESMLQCTDKLTRGRLTQAKC